MRLARLKGYPKTFCYLSLLLTAALVILFHGSNLIFPVIISLSGFLLIVSTVFILSLRLIFSITLSCTLIVVLQFVNQLKVHYYKDKLMFADLETLCDLSNVETLLYYPLAGLALSILLGFIVFNSILSWRVSLRAARVIPRVYCLVVMVMTGISIAYIANNFKIAWESYLPSGTGTIANLIMSASESTYQQPGFNTSSDYFLSQIKNMPVPLHGKKAEKPDIIVLLQESTVKPTFYTLPPNHNVPNLTMFAIDKNVKASGLMRVQTFGGGTWFSEFSLLTGLVSDDFGVQKASVFYTIVDHLNSSLFKELKKNGYYTVVLTPFNKSAYHAGYAYKKMGVDRIVQPQELGYPGDMSDNLWRIASQDMLHYVKILLEEETAGKPLFIFALTMNEHGPYDENYQDQYNLTHFVKIPESAGKFSHYMSKLMWLNSAVQDFSDYVATRKNPTIFLYFGDHQPNIGWKNGYHSPLPDAGYITQFYLKDNMHDRGMISDVGKITDISLLGGMLLERANLSISPFYQANIAMRHACKGALSDCADQYLVNSYKDYIYQDIKVAPSKVD